VTVNARPSWTATTSASRASPIVPSNRRAGAPSSAASRGGLSVAPGTAARTAACAWRTASGSRAAWPRGGLASSMISVVTTPSRSGPS